MLRAILRDGRELTIDASFGATTADLMANLTADSLTGSAVPLADRTIRSAEGVEFTYGDVNLLVEDTAF